MKALIFLKNSENMLKLLKIHDSPGRNPKTSQRVRIQLVEVTGAQGEIGALAALGLYNDVEEAARVHDQT